MGVGFGMNKKVTTTFVQDPRESPLEPNDDINDEKSKPSNFIEEIFDFVEKYRKFKRDVSLK